MAVFNPTVTGFVQPLATSLIVLAGLVASFFVISAGLSLITSRGQPDKLAAAKQSLSRALLGLLLVVAAGSLLGWLQPLVTPSLPATSPDFGVGQPLVAPTPDGQLLAKALGLILGLGQTLIDSLAQPVIEALSHFSQETPLPGQNPTVGRVWLAVLAISNSLFVLVVVLLGFGLMAPTSFGFEHLEFKSLIWRLIVTFLLINLSLLLVDSLVGLANVVNQGLVEALPVNHIWTSLANLSQSVNSLGLAGLLLFLTFLFLAVSLLIYYLIRLVIVYLGAILAPIVFLLALLPAFRDFSQIALKSYLATIFVLFVHSLILAVGAGWLVAAQGEVSWLHLLMATGLFWLLLRTPKILANFNYLTIAPQSLRLLGQQFRGWLFGD